MKHLIPLLLLSSLIPLPSSLYAAVPLKWTVETSRAQPATFDEFAGATYDLEATLQTYGRPLEVVGEPHLYWQTNGMGSAYWTAPATVSGNVLRATWTPACDIGAKAYNCFIGITGTVYNAAFQLRLRPSPGAVPNELPLPQKVIDFSQVEVVNAPWPSAGHARPLPPYLHEISFDYTYPDDAAWAYERSGALGRCSAKREEGTLYRNYDWTFDSTAEFVVRVSGSSDRFASIGVANCGTNLSEDVATSGKWSRWYKCLPGMTLDGINEAGVVAEINVCTTNGMEQWNADGSIHVLGAVRWALDHGTNAAQAAAYLAAHVKRPQGMNFHYMIADERETWIVENGTATEMTGVAIMTNHGMFPFVQGPGVERDAVLDTGAITNAWWTKAYGYGTSWVSDFDSEEQMQLAQELWNAPGKTREDFRGTGSWWQTVHTSTYDISNRTLRVAVQEVDDWYAFAINDKATKTDLASKRDLDDRQWGERTFGAWTVTPSMSMGGIRWFETLEEARASTWLGSDEQFAGPGWYYNAGVGPGVNMISTDRFATSLEHDGHTFVRTETTDRFALESQLAAKRDLDDLAYVTTVPGDWTPSVVDGVWYAPQYYGGGWNVDKYRWQDAYGEWYWEDSEWIGGPGEDAMTLVAHKLWSSEEITLTRSQVPVEDNLALESQIGSVAESAAREYLHGNDLVKWKKILRTGLPGQWGTGWGNVHWEFASDRRWWTMKVPVITASSTAGGYVDTSGTRIAASEVNIGGRSWAADPMSYLTRTPVKILSSTKGTNGTERCAKATWTVALLPTGDPSGPVPSPADVDPDACAFGFTVTIDHALGLEHVADIPRRILPDVVYMSGSYTYAMRDFSAEITEWNDWQAKAVGTYVSDASYSSGSTHQNVTYTNWFTVAFSGSADAYAETTKEYGRVVTSNTHGLYWDPAMKATWRIGVTNGCFFSEIVSTNNLTGAGK